MKIDQPSCLHCVLSEVMEAYIKRYEIEESTPLYAALADVMGDLLSNTPEMFADRDKIMRCFTVRAVERAQSFIDADTPGNRQRLH